MTNDVAAPTVQFRSPLKLGKIAAEFEVTLAAPPRELGFWIIADTHFGHDNIVAYSARPEGHDDLMVERWREHIEPDDLVVHLGDLCGWGEQRADWFSRSVAHRLPGRKLMLLGNHDLESADYYSRCGFELIAPFTIETAEGWRLHFTHKPDEDAVRYPRTLNIHGHTHTRLLRNLRHLNLSVDWTDYAPIRVDSAVAERIAQLQEGYIEMTVPFEYDEWLARKYGQPVTRLDGERWPDDHGRCLDARRVYTEYRLSTANPIAPSR